MQFVVNQCISVISCNYRSIGTVKSTFSLVSDLYTYLNSILQIRRNGMGIR